MVTHFLENSSEVLTSKTDIRNMSWVMGFKNPQVENICKRLSASKDKYHFTLILYTAMAKLELLWY